MSEITLSGYKPNFEQECSRCGESPTVDVIRKGKLAHASDLCGCHFFSDNRMIDPEMWNEEYSDED